MRGYKLLAQKTRSMLEGWSSDLDYCLSFSRRHPHRDLCPVGAFGPQSVIESRPFFRNNSRKSSSESHVSHSIYLGCDEMAGS